MNEIMHLHQQEYQTKAQVIASAPGYLKLLGVDSEENNGYLLLGAINRFVVASISQREDSSINCYSQMLDDHRHSSIHNLKNKKEDRWFNLIKGVVAEFSLLGYHVKGMDIVLSSDILSGIGFGASSAICLSVAIAIRELFELDLTDVQMIQSAYLSEYRFMGLKKASFADVVCSFYSKENKLLRFDNKKMDYDLIPIEDDMFKICLVNSNVPVQIDEDEQAFRDLNFQSIHDILEQKNISSICDLDDFNLKLDLAKIPECARRYCSHIIDENNRVLEAVNALETRKFGLFGKILTHSQQSLRDNYEISCPELDWLIKRALELEGVHGARLTGRGFGGCLMVMVELDMIEEGYQQRLDEYERIFGFEAEFFPIHFSAGAQLLFSINSK